MTMSLDPVATLDRERLACSPMGKLEYVVESRTNGTVEKWFVLRAHRELASIYRAKGMSVPPDGRIVVEANSLQPVGVLDSGIPPPTPHPAGFNPYFDVPPS